MWIDRQSKWRALEEGDLGDYCTVIHRPLLTRLGLVQLLANKKPKLFAEIERQSEWLVNEGKSQEVASTAWACATLGFEAPKLFAQIERQSKRIVKGIHRKDREQTTIPD